MAHIIYTDGTTKRRPVHLGINHRVLWPIDMIHLDVRSIHGKDYVWAVANIKQTERMSGVRLPSVWFPSTFGLQCDVLYWDDERIILKNAVAVFELVKVQK